MVLKRTAFVLCKLVCNGKAVRFKIFSRIRKYKAGEKSDQLGSACRAVAVGISGKTHSLPIPDFAVPNSYQL